MLEIIQKLIAEAPLVTAFAFVGIVIWISNQLGRHVFRGHVAGSAIAVRSQGSPWPIGRHCQREDEGACRRRAFCRPCVHGRSDDAGFHHRRDCDEVQVGQAEKAGWLGVIALLLGTVLPFIVGVSVAYAFGYTDAVTLTTIGAGAVTYIVGPVTGAAIGASSGIIALSIATGVLKAILVMVFTPPLAGFMRSRTTRRPPWFWRACRNRERRERGACSDGPAAGSLWSAGGDLPYRPWLPDGSLRSLPYRQSPIGPKIPRTDRSNRRHARLEQSSTQP